MVKRHDLDYMVDSNYPQVYRNKFAERAFEVAGLFTWNNTETN